MCVWVDRYLTNVCVGGKAGDQCVCVWWGGGGVDRYLTSVCVCVGGKAGDQCVCVGGGVGGGGGQVSDQCVCVCWWEGR